MIQKSDDYSIVGGNIKSRRTPATDIKMKFCGKVAVWLGLILYMEQIPMRKPEEEKSGEAEAVSGRGEGKSVENLEPSGLAHREGESPEQSDAEINYAEIIKPEGALEERIINDLEWQEGAGWGEPRRGHPEGAVIFHIAEVLQNINKLNGISELEREQLRLIALIHDSLKNEVDMRHPRINENQHGMLARRFAEKYSQDDAVLRIIQLHDAAYDAWRKRNEVGGERAFRLINNLVVDLGPENLNLYLLFYQCDNETGTKSREHFQWFREAVSKHFSAYVKNYEERR